MSSKEKNNPAFFYGWVIVVVTMIAGAVLLGIRQSYGVFFKSIEGDFDLNRAATSGIFSVYMAFSAIFAVLGGWSLDKLGAKWTFAAMGLFTGISLLLTSQAQSLWQLYISFSFILAIGTGETYTVVSAAVSRWFVKKRGLALGISQAGGGLGTLIASPLAAYLIISLDWRITYIIMGVIALILVAVPAMLLKSYPGEIGLLPDGARSNTSNNGDRKAVSVKPDGFSVRQALGTRPFWLIYFIWLLHGTATYIFTTHIIPHTTDIGIPALAAATILSVFAVFNVLGGLAVGAASDKIGRRATSIISALFGAGAMIWLLWMPNNLWLFYAFAALFGIAFGGISTIVSALVADIFGMRSVGKIMGLIGIAWFTGAATGPLIAGAIYDAYKNYFFAFLTGAICMVVVVILIAVLTSPKRYTEHH